MKRLEMYKDTPVDKAALKIALDRIHEQFVQGCSDGQVLRIIARRLSAWKLEIGRVRDRRICGWYGIGTDGLGDRSAHFLNEILAAGHRPSPEVLKLCRKLAQADCENQLRTHGRVFSAPGRINIIGEHTDYNQGFVLQAIIKQRFHVVIS